MLRLARNELLDGALGFEQWPTAVFSSNCDI